MTRKQFLKLSIGVAGISAATGALATGCGTTSESKGDCDANGAKDGAISNNHGHTLVIPKEDIAAMVARSYDITGTATHMHMLVISQADFEALMNGQSVTATSSTDGTTPHNHEVTVVCA